VQNVSSEKLNVLPHSIPEIFKFAPGITHARKMTKSTSHEKRYHKQANLLADTNEINKGKV
jgi:hypothetical protein